MNRLLIIVATVIFGFTAAYAQCVPLTSTGSFSIAPTTDNLQCVEQGVAYTDTVSFENLDDLSINIIIQTITIPIDFLRFDSIGNLPCGLEYEFDRALPASYSAAETGCLRIFGTTTEPVGQYPVKIYITLQVTIPNTGISQIPSGPQSFSGEATDVIGQIEALLAQSPVAIPIPVSSEDFKYWMRVTAPAGACNPADVTGASDLTSASPCFGPGQFGIDLTGDEPICADELAALVANVIGNPVGPVTFSWTSGSSTSSDSVGAGSVTITVTDSVGTVETITTTVTEILDPVADFTVTENNGTVTFNNTTTNGSSYEWDFGNGTTSSQQNPGAVNYATTDTFDVVLICTNDCGVSDTVSYKVYPTLTGIANRGLETVSVNVYPNPNNGAFNVSINDVAGNLSLRVVTIAGQTVYTNTLVATGGAVNQSISVEQFGKGMYLLYVESENFSGVTKLIVQ